MKKQVLFTGLLWLAAQTLSTAQAQPAQEGAQDKKPVTIRYLSGRGQISAPEIAQAMGWLQAQGVTLESKGYSQGGPESLFAMASGSVDLADAATSAIINAIANGSDIVSVMASGGVNEDVRSRFYVLEGSPIHQPSDLVGKTIAVNTRGAHLDYVVREYLRRNNIPYNAVRLVTVPGPQLAQTLRSGQVDVAAVGAWQSVFAGQLEAQGGVRSLFDDHQLLGDITLSPVAMERAFIKAHPQAVRTLVTQSGRAADWARDHPEQARALISKLLTERHENSKLADYWKGFGVREHGLLTEHDVQYWLDTLERDGTLPKGRLTVSDVATNAYNDAAGDELAGGEEP